MYTPKHFQADNIVDMQRLMQEYNFAILVTQADGVPQVSHLPFLLDNERGSSGVLVAHMALANPQWRSFESDKEVLVIFQGPHAYITPSWYEKPLSVPTWNFAVVHAYGTPRIIRDQSEMYRLLDKLTRKFEAQFEKQWWLSDLPDDYVHRQMQGTVGFEIEITRLEGKFKLSQNRSEHERLQVAEMLQGSQDSTSQELATLMLEREKKQEKGCE